MKEYAKAFYSSRAWKNCRKNYAASRGGLCERCLAKGIYKPGVIVHHKVYISPENIDNPMVTLNWENLELVCRECHDEEHEFQKHRKEYQNKHRKHPTKRWSVDPEGNVVPLGQKGTA